MKRKKFFSILLQSGIIFVFMADLFKLILRNDSWISVATFSFVFSFLGAIFYEYNFQNENGKIVSFAARKNNKGQCLTLIFVSIVIGVIIAFINGVVLEKSWILYTIISMIWFYVGANLYKWTKKLKR